jgi:hypothetical protein
MGLNLVPQGLNAVLSAPLPPRASAAGGCKARDAGSDDGKSDREALLVRGSKLARVVAIRASVDEVRFQTRDVEPTWDAITVGQLILRKRIADFIEAVAILAPSA